MNRYLTFFLTLLLMLLLFVGCSDASDNPDVSSDGPDTSDTSAPDTSDTSVPDTTEETVIPIQPPVPTPSEPFTVTDSDGTVTVRALKVDAGSVYRYWNVQNEALFLLYDTVYDKDGNWTRLAENIRFAVFDTASGTMIESEMLDTDTPPLTMTLAADGKSWILYNYNYEMETPQIAAAWLVTYTDGKLHVEPSPVSSLLYRSNPVMSPDGKYLAYTEQDSIGDGGIALRRLSDGETVRILDNVMYDETPDGIGGVRGYSPIGFLPDGRLVYNITGWEWCIGYGFYNIADGTKTEVENGMRVSFIRDGVLYGTKTSSYAVQALCILEENGESRTLVDEKTAEHPAARAMFTEEGYYQYTKDGLVVLRMGGEDGDKAYLFSHDAKTLRAELTLTENFPVEGRFVFVLGEDSLTLVY